MLTMDLYDLVDALSAAFFALLGVWAALDRRHWFLRFAVVSVFLFASLLVPAFEIVLEFGVLILLINAGVWLGTLRRNWPPRLSMESALLAMVVVAVLCAVAGAVPSLDARTWGFCMSVAFGGAAIALGCVQLVFGARPLLVRVLLFPAFVAAALAAIALIEAIERAALGRGFVLPIGLQDQADFIKEHGGAFQVGTFLIIAALWLARETRWFHDAEEDAEPVRWRLVGSRWTLATLVTTIFAPLLLIFLRLLFPTPLPPIELPNPNGYDDIVAAGRMTPQEELQSIFAAQAAGGNLASLEADLARLSPMYELIDQGLTNPIVSPYYHPKQSEQARKDAQAEWCVLLALLLRADLAWRTSSEEETIEGLLRPLLLSRTLAANYGVGWSAANWAEPTFVQYVQLRLRDFDSKTCRWMLEECTHYDSSRTPADTIRKRQRIIDDNIDWKNNLWNTLADVSGEDRYEWVEDWQRTKAASMRLTIAQLGVQAYYAERGKPPVALSDVVPDYLPEVPLDPFTGEPLRHSLSPAAATFYSVGHNGADDTAVKAAQRSDDIVSRIAFPAPGGTATEAKGSEASQPEDADEPAKEPPPNDPAREPQTSP